MAPREVMMRNEGFTQDLMRPVFQLRGWAKMGTDRTARGEKMGLSRASNDWDILVVPGGWNRSHVALRAEVDSRCGSLEPWNWLTQVCSSQDAAKPEHPGSLLGWGWKSWGENGTGEWPSQTCIVSLLYLHTTIACPENRQLHSIRWGAREIGTYLPPRDPGSETEQGFQRQSIAIQVCRWQWPSYPLGRGWDRNGLNTETWCYGVNKKVRHPASSYTWILY